MPDITGTELQLALKACLSAELAKTAAVTDPVTGISGWGPVTVATLAFGVDVPASDYCCESDTGVGQAWVRTARFEPEGAGVCGNDGKIWETLGVGVWRCAPTMNSKGFVHPDDLTAHAVKMRIDADAIRRAVRCCPGMASSGWLFVEMVPLGDEGACTGWEYRLRYNWIEEPCPIRTAPIVPVVPPVPF